jgi:hypothetical protein
MTFSEVLVCSCTLLSRGEAAFSSKKLDMRRSILAQTSGSGSGVSPTRGEKGGSMGSLEGATVLEGSLGADAVIVVRQRHKSIYANFRVVRNVLLGDTRRG